MLLVGPTGASKTNSHALTLQEVVLVRLCGWFPPHKLIWPQFQCLAVEWSVRYNQVTVWIVE